MAIVAIILVIYCVGAVWWLSRHSDECIDNEVKKADFFHEWNEVKKADFFHKWIDNMFL